MSQSQRFILPTFQGTLNLCIQECVRRMNAGLVLETWKALETLYDTVPAVWEDLESDYKTIRAVVERELRRRRAVDPFIDDVKRNQVLNVIAVLNREFYRKLMFKLEDKGYLEKKLREIPHGIQKGLNL